MLLGEASRDTAQYYSRRAEITRRVIVEKEFSFVAVESDWPDCYRVNRCVKWARRCRLALYGSGLRAVADVDVGQRGGGGLRGLVTGAQRRPGGEAMHLRDQHHVNLDPLLVLVVPGVRHWLEPPTGGNEAHAHVLDQLQSHARNLATTR